MATLAVEDERLLDAFPAVVWAAIADPSLHAQWHPFVQRIDGSHSLGAVRTCHVQFGQRSGRSVERCVAREEDRRIAWAIEEDSTGFARQVADWTSGFTLEPRGAGTLVRASSAFRPRSLLVRLMAPMVRRQFHQVQRRLLREMQAFVLQRQAEGQRPATSVGEAAQGKGSLGVN